MTSNNVAAYNSQEILALLQHETLPTTSHTQLLNSRRHLAESK